MAMRLHLTETREQLTVVELAALDDAMEAVLSELKVMGVPAAGDDRLALMEQAIGDFIIASR